jgi:hypothetical protein
MGLNQLRARPLFLLQANAVVDNIHRHHVPARGHRFSIGCYLGDRLIGVAIVGRPVARGVPQDVVAEVARLATDGTKNACSFLYSACARACLAMGFEYIQTYTLEEEPGTSLIASGWRDDGLTDGGSWNAGTRKGRRDDQPQVRKRRWRKDLNLSHANPI